MDKVTTPVVGQEVYVPTQGYISRGEDDVRGGLARISEVEVREDLPPENRVFVGFEELPKRKYSFSWLMQHQEDWKKEYGDQRARPDPDPVSEPW